MQYVDSEYFAPEVATEKKLIINLNNMVFNVSYI